MSRWFIKANTNKVSIKMKLDGMTPDMRVNNEQVIKNDAKNIGCTILVQTSDKYDYITIEGERAQEIADRYLKNFPEYITIAEENIDVTPGEEIVKQEVTAE